MKNLDHLDDEDLLDLYTSIVKVDHIDSYKTLQFAKDLYEAGISQFDIKRMILKRMEDDLI